MADQRPVPAIATIAVVSSVAATLSAAAPTGRDIVDDLIVGAVALLVTVATGWARRFVVTGVSLAIFALSVTSSAVAQLVAAGGVVVSTAGWVERPGRRVARSLAGGLAINALLRLELDRPHGLSAILGLALVAAVLVSAMTGLRRSTRRGVVITTIALAGLAALAALLTGGNALALRSETKRAADDLRAGVADLSRGDRPEAADHFDRAARRFDRVSKGVERIWARPGLATPVLSQNIGAVADLADLGEELAVAAARTARVVDVDAVRLEGGRVDLTSVAELEDPLTDALETLEQARARLSELDSPWLLDLVSREVAALTEEIDEALPDARNAVDAVRVAGPLLGGDGPRRYFIAVQQPSEMRGNGGFVGNYGELVTDDGSIELTRFGRIQELNDAGPEEKQLVGPADFVARWERFGLQYFFQDVTVSPDFPTVAEAIEGLYPQSGGQGVDGVISVDPYGLAALLRLTGPVEVPGLEEPLTHENAAQFLVHDQYVEFAGDNAERREFLDLAAAAVFDALTSRDLPPPPTVADALGPAVREGRLKLHSVHEDEQELFRSLGWAGEFPPLERDFFAVVTQNAGHNKIDAFFERSVNYEATVDTASGRTEAVLTVGLHNGAPARGLPDYVIGGDAQGGRGYNRMQVSIYSPLRLERATFDGETLAMETHVELERFVYVAWVEVPPESRGRLVLELEGRVKVAGDGYELAIAHQPLVEPDRVSVRVRGARGGDLVNEQFELREHALLAAR